MALSLAENGFTQPVRKKPASATMPAFYRASLPLLKPVRRIVAGDFNGDGQLDLAGLVAATGRGGGKLSLFYNGGSGNPNSLVSGFATASGKPTPPLFTDATDSDLRGEPSDLSVFDFNGDHIDDLAVFFERTAKVRFLLGGRGNRLTPAGDLEVESGTHSICISDADGDGRHDLYAIGDGAGVQVFHQGERAAERLRFKPGGKRFATSAYTHLLLDNFANSELGLDFVLTTAADNELTLFRNERVAAWAEPVKLRIRSDVAAMTATDFNRNTVPDVVLALAARSNATAGGDAAGGQSPAPAQLAVVYDFGIETHIRPLMLDAGIAPTVLRLADLNADGFPDILALDAAEESISIYTGKEDGTFQPRMVLGTGGEAADLEVKDLDGDRLPELIFSDLDAKSLVVLSTKPVSLQSAAPEVKQWVTAAAPRSMVALSGALDGALAVACEGSASIAVMAASLPSGGFGGFGGLRRAGTAAHRLADVALPVSPSRLWTLGTPERSMPKRKDAAREAEKAQVYVVFSAAQEKLCLVSPGGTETPVLAETNVLGASVAAASFWAIGEGDAALALYDEGDLDIQPQTLYYRLRLRPSPSLTELVPDVTLPVDKAETVAFAASKEKSKGIIAMILPDLRADLKSEAKSDVLKIYQWTLLSESRIALSPTELRLPKSARNAAPRTVLLEDFDGDGKTDCLVFSGSDATLYGSRRLYAPAQMSNFARISKGDFLKCLDLNGDALPDVLIGNRKAATLSVAFNAGDGALHAPVEALTNIEPEDALIVPYSASGAGGTGDGQPALAVANSKQDTIDFLPLAALKQKMPQKTPKAMKPLSKTEWRPETKKK